MSEWIPENNRASSTMFLCPWCAGKVYYIHGASALKYDTGQRKHCGYHYCPWCGKEVNQMEKERYDVTELIKNFEASTNASISFQMDAENTQKFLKEIIHGLMEKCGRLQKEVKHCRNELCLKCGCYQRSHLGSCDGCRFRHGGEWSVDLDE